MRIYQTSVGEVECDNDAWRFTFFLWCEKKVKVIAFWPESINTFETTPFTFQRNLPIRAKSMKMMNLLLVLIVFKPAQWRTKKERSWNYSEKSWLWCLLQKYSTWLSQKATWLSLALSWAKNVIGSEWGKIAFFELFQKKNRSKLPPSLLHAQTLSLIQEFR